MKSSFTPAPWSAIGGYYPGMIDINCGKKMSICVVISANDLTWQDGMERQANCHLIAAAPEMYAMLDRLSSQLTDINAHSAANEIEALLAKARGEQ